jgi:hypothetical protein
MSLQRQQYSWAQGAYDDGTNPHRIYQPNDIETQVGWDNTFGFYSREKGNAAGVLPSGSSQFSFSYPLGPIYPNPYMYFASVPGKVDLKFHDRPFL